MRSWCSSHVVFDMGEPDATDFQITDIRCQAYAARPGWHEFCHDSAAEWIVPLVPMSWQNSSLRGLKQI